MWRKFIFPFVFIAFIIIVMESADRTFRESTPLQKEETAQRPMVEEQQSIAEYATVLQRPNTGVSTYISKPLEKWEKKYGEADRIEPSMYGYDWHVYRNMKTMVGVTEDGTINQVYTMNEEVDVTPYVVKQSKDHVFSSSIVETEIVIPFDGSDYMFSLTQEEVQEKLLIPFEGLNAQLYFDRHDERVEAIRFIDDETLILHQPYDLYYDGEPFDRQVETADALNVKRAVERQLIDLTNWIRAAHRKSKLEQDYSLTLFARRTSELLRQYEETAEKLNSLPNRLKQFNIKHEKAGENTALSHADPIEVIHNFLNSLEHRTVMLYEHYSHIGTGLDESYYVIEYIQKPVEEVVSPELE